MNTGFQGDRLESLIWMCKFQCVYYKTWYPDTRTRWAVEESVGGGELRKEPEEAS
jgi:hypothetical protein